MRKKIAKIEQMLERLKLVTSWKTIEQTVYLAYFEGKGDVLEALITKNKKEVKK